MLGDIWQKIRDAEHSYKKGTLETKRRNAQAMLLGRMYTSRSSPLEMVSEKYNHTFDDHDAFVGH